MTHQSDEKQAYIFCAYSGTTLEANEVPSAMVLRGHVSFSSLQDVPHCSGLSVGEQSAQPAGPLEYVFIYTCM